ncbi:hypothetical protein GCM10009861_20280 [Neomicrococcus aestuarii]
MQYFALVAAQVPTLVIQVAIHCGPRNGMLKNLDREHPHRLRQLGIRELKLLIADPNVPLVPVPLLVLLGSVSF